MSTKIKKLNFTFVFALILFLLIWGFSCTREPVLVEMFNTSDLVTMVSLDGRKPITLKKFQYHSEQLPPGKHTVKFDKEPEMEFVLDYKTKILLNPGGGNFYLKKIDFASQKSQQIVTLGRVHDTLTVGGYKVVGGFVSLGNDKLIKNTWDFGLRKAVPNSIEIKEDKYSLGFVSTTKLKLMSENNIINEVELEYKKAIRELRESEATDEMIKIILELSNDQFIHLTSSMMK